MANWGQGLTHMRDGMTMIAATVRSCACFPHPHPGNDTDEQCTGLTAAPETYTATFGIFFFRSVVAGNRLGPASALPSIGGIEVGGLTEVPAEPVRAAKRLAIVLYSPCRDIAMT